MNWLLLVLILLYPVQLSELTGDFLRALPPQTPSAHAQEPAKPELRLTDTSSVDREAFLASFSRQAGVELVPCLKNQGERLGALSLIARLSKQGRLTSVRLVAPKTIDKGCVIEATEKMTFPAVGAKLQKENVEIAWRFEW